MTDSFSFSSRRSAVYGRGGMVATSQTLAVAAGLQALAAGGTAADSAIAAAAALNVTEPTSTGLGGDAFALYYQANKQQVFALNGSGRAPAALTLERLRREGLGDNLPPTHPYTITVPGRRPPGATWWAALGACRWRRCWPPPFDWRKRASRYHRSPPTSGSGRRRAAWGGRSTGAS